ncbi:MAG: DUF3047 domain-containing protein [Oscillatoria princeps RMCB-10]|nr:DUF3047 domain-containing protein [Oscillatoria princeps RMCB-10]
MVIRRIIRTAVASLAGLLVVLLAHAGSLQAQSGTVLEVGKFSAAQVGDNLPAGWEPLTFRSIRKHTQYSLVQDSDTVVVKAVSSASASGLIRKIEIDPREYPIVQWQWKVSNILQKGDVNSKQGDDYPARVYIAFGPGNPPARGITYIWESKTPKGKIVRSPYTNRISMFVVDSGEANLNQWVTQERNIYEDYKLAFGQEPPKIAGVAIMTDSDNTGEMATAYYGDIVFKKRAN